MKTTALVLKIRKASHWIKSNLFITLVNETVEQILHVLKFLCCIMPLKSLYNFRLQKVLGNRYSVAVTVRKK